MLLVLDTFRPRNVHALAPAIRLADLVDEDAELAPGPHELIAVLAHASGETVKPDAGSTRPFDRVRFWVGASAPDAGQTLEQPLLVYNLPRGTYNGEAASDAVLLDFYVLGSLAAKSPRVRVSVTGDHDVRAQTLLTEWRPLLVHGLPSGDYTVRLALVDADDQPVPGARTAAERTITLNRDAPVGKRE